MKLAKQNPFADVHFVSPQWIGDVVGHMNKYTHQNSEFLNHNYVVKSSTKTTEHSEGDESKNGGEKTKPEATTTQTTTTHGEHQKAESGHAHGYKIGEHRHLTRKREVVKINSIPKQGILGIAFALQHCKSVDIYGFGNMKEDGSPIDHAHYYDLT